MITSRLHATEPHYLSQGGLKDGPYIAVLFALADRSRSQARRNTAGDREVVLTNTSNGSQRDWDSLPNL